MNACVSPAFLDGYNKFVRSLLQLSEMTADLAEEHSTATLATDRLEAEQADRLKLEKEKAELKVSFITRTCATIAYFYIYLQIASKHFR